VENEMDELQRLFEEDESLHEQMEFPPLPEMPSEDDEVLVVFHKKKDE
jgi:hypothetical protein